MSKNYIDYSEPKMYIINAVRPGLSNQRGSVSFKALFWVLFLSSALYGAYKLAPPYFSYYMIKTDVEDEAQNAHMYTDAALERRIIQKAEIWSVPLGSENVSIDRDSTIRIYVHYNVVLEFFGGYTRVLEYRISVEKPLKGRLE